MFFASQKDFNNFCRTLGLALPVQEKPKPEFVPMPLPVPMPMSVSVKAETPVIDRVIFQDTATVVFWKDGTKTVVKTQNGETFDKEKGLAMAFVKKIHGNTRDYYDIFLKYCKDDEPVTSVNTENTDNEKDK